MEKLKFALQVFTAVLALPLLSMLELNHNKKISSIDTIRIEQGLIQNARNWYLENNARIYAVHQKKHFGMRHCK